MTAPHRRGIVRRTATLIVAPLLLMLLSTFVLPAPAATAAATVAYPPVECDEYPEGVPIEAYYLVDHLRSHNFSPPQNWVGGRVYRDDDHRLGRYSGDATLYEYDVYPKVPGQPRRAERIVLVKSFLPMAWYSPDHYTTFIPMYDLGCLGFGRIHIPII